MTWVKIDDQFPDHPKVLAAGPAAAWLYVCGLCYASRYLTDGFVPAGVVSRLSDLKRADDVATRLVDAGLWEAADGGYRIHDYLDYQRSASEVDEVSAKRAEAGRRGGMRSGEARREANAKQVASLGLEANAKQNRSRVQSTELTDTEQQPPLPPKPANGAAAAADFRQTYPTTLGDKWSIAVGMLTSLSPEVTEGMARDILCDVERDVGVLSLPQLRKGLDAARLSLERAMNGPKPIAALKPFATKVIADRLREVANVH